MTVDINDRRARYEATAGQTIFDVDFPISADTEVEVWHKVDATGDITLLTLTTDYTVTLDGAAPNTADVTLVTGAAIDDIISIEGNTSPVRESDFQTGGDYFAGTVNTAEDKQYFIMQERERDLDRTAKLNPIQADDFDPQLPEFTAENQVIAVNSALDGFKVSTIASLGAVVLSNIVALVNGIASAGTSTEVSRVDHVHPLASAVTETLTNKTLNDPSNLIHSNGVHQSCRNVSGGTLSALTPVYDNGWNAGQSRIEILKADANGVGTYPALGVLDEDILNNANGEVLATGTISDVDASGTPVSEVWADGDTLYVSETAGELTNVRPTASGSQVQSIARVLRAHATNGVIFVQGAGRVNDVPNLITADAQIQWKKGADVASAAALPILKDGNIFDVTGTTTITSINTTGQIGTVIKLHFDGAVLLTHHATNLIIPGAANYTTEAGDEIEFTEYASGDWRITGYALADGGSIIAAGSSKIVQVVNVTDSAVASGTTVLPRDDTIPQNTEGDEYMTLAITPTNTNNKLLIEVNAVWSISTSVRLATMALFQDTTADALAASSDHETTGTGMNTAVLRHYMTAGTTSSTTFKIRIGSNASGTLTFNGHSGGRQYGGVAASSITITEIAV